MNDPEWLWIIKSWLITQWLISPKVFSRKNGPPGEIALAGPRKLQDEKGAGRSVGANMSPELVGDTGGSNRNFSAVPRGNQKGKECSPGRRRTEERKSKYPWLIPFIITPLSPDRSVDKVHNADIFSSGKKWCKHPLLLCHPSRHEDPKEPFQPWAPWVCECWVGPLNRSAGVYTKQASNQLRGHPQCLSQTTRELSWLLESTQKKKEKKKKRVSGATMGRFFCIFLQHMPLRSVWHVELP